MKMPPKPYGNTARVAYDRQMWDYIQSLTPMKGDGIRLNQSERGTTYSIEKRAGAGGTSVNGHRTYIAWFALDNQVEATSITYSPGENAVSGIRILTFEDGDIILNNNVIEHLTDPPTSELLESHIFFFRVQTGLKRSRFYSTKHTIQFS